MKHQGGSFVCRGLGKRRVFWKALRAGLTSDPASRSRETVAQIRVSHSAVWRAANKSTYLSDQIQLCNRPSDSAGTLHCCQCAGMAITFAQLFYSAGCYDRTYSQTSQWLSATSALGDFFLLSTILDFNAFWNVLESYSCTHHVICYFIIWWFLKKRTERTWRDTTIYQKQTEDFYLHF